MGRPRQNPASLRRRLLGSLEYSREEAYNIWDQSRRAVGEVESSTGTSFGRNVAEEERMHAREPPSLNAQSTMNSESDGPSMPAVPEADSFARSQERHRTLHRARQTRDQLRRMARRHAAPTPPYFEEDLDITGGRDFGETHRTYYHSSAPSHISTFDNGLSPVASSITLPPFTSLPNTRSPAHQSGDSSPRRPVGDESEPLNSFLSRMDVSNGLLAFF